MKVLDSTFLIDLLRGRPETKKIWEQHTLFLTTQINLYEVFVGLFFQKVSARKMAEAQELFEHIRVLPLDDQGIIQSSEIAADLMKQGAIVEDCDCLTAGISLSKGVRTIVTRNEKHFKRIKGISVETY